MIVAAVTIASVALLVSLLLTVQVVGLRRRLRAVPKDGDIVGLMREMDTDLAAAETLLASIQPRLESVEAALPHAVSHMGVVSFDAFGDITGNLSRAIALLDGVGDGMVLTVLVGRSETLFFAKQIRGGRGAEKLSPEEHAAVDRALAG